MSEEYGTLKLRLGASSLSSLWVSMAQDFCKTMEEHRLSLGREGKHQSRGESGQQAKTKVSQSENMAILGNYVLILEPNAVGEGEREKKWGKRRKQNETVVDFVPHIKASGSFPPGKVWDGWWRMPSGLTYLILSHLPENIDQTFFRCMLLRWASGTRMSMWAFNVFHLPGQRN